MSPPRRILVTISDGTLLTVVGIHLLWRSLLRHRREFGDEWEAVVLVPSWAWPLAEGGTDLLRGHRILAIEHTRREDPYAAKLVFRAFVSTLPNSTEVLYLDYDHVCLAPLLLATPPDGAVLVGSRIGRLRLLEGAGDRPEARSLQRLTRDMHFNSSLLHGLCSTMDRASEFWQAEYDSLTGIVDPRVLEETAFTASAIRAGVNIKPVPLGVQADWERPAPDARLFHYGGESDRAMTLKSALPSLLRAGGLPQDCVAMLRTDAAGARILEELAAPEA